MDDRSYTAFTLVGRAVYPHAAQPVPAAPAAVLVSRLDHSYVNCWSRICVVKRVTVALLVFSVFTPAVFAQSVEALSFEQAQHRLRMFSGWLEMVKGAERDYKNKNGRYGDLATLRKAHLLRSLFFESGSSAAPKGKSQDNF